MQLCFVNYPFTISFCFIVTCSIITVQKYEFELSKAGFSTIQVMDL